MRLVRGVHNIQPSSKGCVLTIGNFDGVHLGHRRVIEALVAQAKKYNCVSAVMVFEPQPQELFFPETAPARLSRLRDKYVLLKELGVEQFICVNFNEKFAQLSANDFIEQLLVKQLNVKHLIIGDDFRFGFKRTGDYKMLCKAGAQYDFSVTDTQSYKMDNCRISSTKIRHLLETNQLAAAEKMLGRPYSIIGKVIHGDKKGRELGFPTANVLLKRLVSPVSGVYVVKVKTPIGVYFGVANIGSRPTVNGVRQQLEVHIFEFNNNLYRQTITVQLLSKLREEQRFDSLAKLTEQIKIDSEQAKQFINQTVS